MTPKYLVKFFDVLLPLIYMICPVLSFYDTLLGFFEFLSNPKNYYMVYFEPIYSDNPGGLVNLGIMHIFTGLFVM